MKTPPCATSKISWLALALAPLCLGALAGLTGCANSGGSGGGYSYPDPAEKQIKMQEEMSQVTRSFL